MSRIARRTGLPLAALFTAAAISGCTEVPTAEVGACLNSADFSGEEVTDIPALSCEEPHDLEVYHLSTVADGAFPGEKELEETAEQACVEAFEPYVGADFSESALAITFMTPSQRAWEAGDDREIICLLQSEETTGSLKDSEL